MITPVNQIYKQGYVYSRPVTAKNKTESQNQTTSLPDYKTGIAILARNNVSFKTQKVEDISSVYNRKISDDFITIQYPYKSTGIKDDYVAFLTTMMLIFLTPPFHDKESNINRQSNGNSYYKLIFNPAKDKNNTYGECYEKQQQLFSAIYEMDTRAILNGLKDYSKEITVEKFNKNIIDEKTKNNYIKIINSISDDDIKNNIKTNLINQKAYVTI